MGRPKISKAEARNRVFTIRLKDEEIKEIQIIAEQQGLTLSEYVRKALRKQLDVDSRNI